MIEPAALAALEAQVGIALDRGDSGTLDVLGYGEISTVLLAEGIAGPVAAKRLPAMSRIQLTSYRRVLEAYLSALQDRGIATAPSEVHAVGEDPAVPYCVQPLQSRLLVDELRTASNGQAREWFQQLADHVSRAADGEVGLDGQLSNWAVREDGSLLYFDVTTPLLRDKDGAEQLDLDLFIASLPWALQALVRRFLLREILSHYYAPRPVLVDAAGNLHKEKLPHLIEPLLDAAASVIEPGITVDDALRYYRFDARMWAMLQRLRKADRWWQHRIRRRRYAFLLPGAIER